MTVSFGPSAGPGRRRWLRPAHLVPTPAGVWLLEDVQPVAAFVDTAASVDPAVFAGAGGPLRLVDWAGTAPAPPDSPRVAVADGDGFAVQDGEGAMVRARRRRRWRPGSPGSGVVVAGGP